jgi:hypothetical protein
VNRKGPKAGHTCFEKEILRRLAVSLDDNGRLIALYENYKRELEAATAHYFGKTQLAKKAVLNLLVAVSSRAWTCDLQTIHTKKWLVRCADVEARKLREALGAAVRRNHGTRSAK